MVQKQKFGANRLCFLLAIVGCFRLLFGIPGRVHLRSSKRKGSKRLDSIYRSDPMMSGFKLKSTSDFPCSCS